MGSCAEKVVVVEVVGMVSSGPVPAPVNFPPPAGATRRSRSIPLPPAAVLIRQRTTVPVNGEVSGGDPGGKFASMYRIGQGLPHMLWVVESADRLDPIVVLARPEPGNAT